MKLCLQLNRPQNLSKNSLRIIKFLLNLTFSSRWTSDQIDLLKALQQPALGVEEKYRVLEARDKLIRLCTKKEIDMRTTCTIGTCPDMCSEKERLMREVQHQVK